MKYFDFDMETSGLDPNQHQILSIGAYRPGMDPLYLTIQHKMLNIDTAAMEVNGLYPLAGTQDIHEGDNELSHWIHSLRNGERAMPVGFRVESFDLKFLRAHLPMSFDRLRRDDHGVDLNACIHWAAHVHQVEPAKMKSHLKTMAIEILGDVQEHHALDDARIAYEIWHIITTRKSIPRIKD